MQMMKSLTDDSPTLVDTGMFVKAVKWNPNGNVLAVCGSLMDGTEGSKGVVQFYNAFGIHLRSLRVPSYTGMVNSVSWEGFGLRIALAVDTNILFSNIQPEYMWGYFSNTLVFAFRKPERNDMCIIFWDVLINEKHVKYMKRLQKIAACDEYCCLIAKNESQANQWYVVLCNAVGCPIDSKTITIEPKHVAMSKTHIIIASDEVVYYWQFRSKHNNIVQGTKKTGKENAFHIEDTPKADGIYDKDKWTTPSIQCQDQISAIAASQDSFLIGKQSGEVLKFSLPYIQLENKMMLRCRPQQLKLNCNSTKFSIIDINGMLSFFDLNDQEGTPDGTHLPTERKEVWSIVWSTDNPSLCALMEKNRLFVLRDFEPEEPVLSAGYLCDFTDLEVKSVLLDDILKDPEEIKNIQDMFVDFEAKSLRDTRDLLTTVSLKDAVDFVEKNPHRRLWKLVTEAALDKLNFTIGERAFVKNEDYYGV
jgi:WD repeat-containing protein 35